MPVEDKTQQQIDAEAVLSARELEVAMLARIHVGRNGIAGVLSVSVNSVKTILRRIKDKLGPDWQGDKSISWPNPKAEYQEAKMKVHLVGKYLLVFLYTSML